MYKNLHPGMIGIQGLSLAETIDLACEMDFTGVEIDIMEIRSLAAEKGVGYIRDLLNSSGRRAGHWLMLNDWKKSEAEWKQMLTDLPALAKLASVIGCTRSCTYFGSGSNERDYDENFQWHAERLRPVAAILNEYGIRFGMEFMGPISVRRDCRYEFIHTMGQMLSLAEEIGTGNAGLLLDSWHLYTSGGTADEMLAVPVERIVNVHINDAPAGLTIDEYADCDRRLPLETGVIDLAAFMRALQTIGYDGPVTLEPFSAELNALAESDPAAASGKAKAVMENVWALTAQPVHSD